MQVLRIDGIETTPDTNCPECGKPWKEGADYGHQICCGCTTCGYSNCLIEIDEATWNKITKGGN